MSIPTLVSRFGLSVFAVLSLLPESAFSASSTVRGHQAVTKSVRPPVLGPEGSQVTLTAPQGPRGTRYQWDLNNDGRFEKEGRKLTVRFSDNGTYRVKYRLVAPGASKKALRARRTVLREGTQRIAIGNVAPAARLKRSYNTTPGKVVRFKGGAHDISPEDRRAGFTYLWDFGDGSRVKSGKKLRKPSHKYKQPGVYTVSLVVRDKDKSRSAPVTTVVSVSNAGAGESSGSNPPSPASSNPEPTIKKNPEPTTKKPPTKPAGSKATPAPVNGPVTTVRPSEIQDTLANPGMGWQSNDRVNTSGKDAQGLPNKVAYIKYYWRDIETSDNVYDWSQMDNHLNQARNSGQSWGFRISVDEPYVSAPDWLRNQGVPGYWYTAEGGPQVWTPNWNNGTARQKHFEFLQAVAQRYDGKPGVDHVDIGSVGMWGEWHWGDTNPDIPMPSQSSLNQIIDKYFEYFPSIPKVAQLEHEESLRYAVQRGAGIRGDCLGNMQWQNRVSPPGMYDMRIDAAQAHDAWKNGPVIFETCWTIDYWVNQGWDLRRIFDWALDNHVSAINNKNRAVPASAMSEVQRFLRRMGYRYVLRELQTPQSARAGERITVSMEWENVGVSPSYGNQRLAFQLRNASGAQVAKSTTNTAVRKWMPGALAVDESFTIPSGLPAGNYTLAVGIVDPQTGNPAVQLAISGRDNNGWYPLTTIRVQ